MLIWITSGGFIWRSSICAVSSRVCRLRRGEIWAIASTKFVVIVINGGMQCRSPGWACKASNHGFISVNPTTSSTEFHTCAFLRVGVFAGQSWRHKSDPFGGLSWAGCGRIRVAKGGCGEGLVATGVAGVGNKWCADGWTWLRFGWFHSRWILGFSIFGTFLAVSHKVRLHPVSNSSTKHFSASCKHWHNDYIIYHINMELAQFHYSKYQLCDLTQKRQQMTSLIGDWFASNKLKQCNFVRSRDKFCNQREVSKIHWHEWVDHLNQ